MRGRCKICFEETEINVRELCNKCDCFSDEQILKAALLKQVAEKKFDFVCSQEMFLRQFGWYSTSKFPDHIWLWVKVVRGETIAVSRDAAVNIERNIAHYKN